MDIKHIIEQHALWLATNGKEGYRANLSRANLAFADLSYANLARADLSSANLAFADLSYADLSSANLAFADLSYADLSRANLARADLKDVNLKSANLEGTNLERANLKGVFGNLDHLKSIFCETYPVTYTAEVMQIGCQQHTLEDWWSFDDDRIIAMDGEKALNWWRIWKPILQQIIAVSPATATGYGCS